MSRHLRFFPPETLAEIFGAISSDILDITCVSHVSRQWRDAALDASELWLSVHIREADLNHTDVVRDHFLRSQRRPICLELQFASTEPSATQSERRAFLESVVRPNLQRCRSLKVQATRPHWEILTTFAQETYPLLRVLDIMAVHFWTRAQPYPDPNELRFVLPQNHRLEELSIHGINVGDITLPHMRALRVGGQLQDLVGPDGQINRWLLHGPQTLELCNLPIPPMYFQTEERGGGASSVLHLKLTRIYASTTADGIQDDCAPFFDALQTPRIQTLELEAFHGRAWEDFLFALNTPALKYPLLTALVLKSFDFQNLSYVGVRFFLRSFPELESIVLAGCPLSTWETVLHVLILHPELCVFVGAVEVNGVLLNRRELLPFAMAGLLEDHENREHRVKRSFFGPND